MRIIEYSYNEFGFHNTPCPFRLKERDYPLVGCLNCKICKYFIEDNLEKRYIVCDYKESKPPLGLVPRYISDSKRKAEILEAVVRYVNADKCIPLEWIFEYNEIADREENRLNKLNGKCK